MILYTVVSEVKEKRTGTAGPFTFVLAEHVGGGMLVGGTATGPQKQFIPHIANLTHSRLQETAPLAETVGHVHAKNIPCREQEYHTNIIVV